MVVEDACYSESEAVANSIIRIINLTVERLEGKFIPSEEIEHERKELIKNNLKLKKCILSVAKK